MARSKRTNPGCAIAFVLFVAVVWILSVATTPESSDKESDESAETHISSESEGQLDELPSLDDQIKAILGSNSYLYTDVDILEQCGVTDIRDARLIQDSGEPHNLKVYRIDYDEDRTLLITFENNSLYYVAFNGTDLYTTTDGVIMKMQDVHIPETDIPLSYVSQLQMICEDIIKKYLNYPLTADFHTFEWAYGREDNKYVVQGSVTASNAFGVPDKMPFKVWLEHDPEAGEMKPTGVSLDGAIVYSK